MTRPAAGTLYLVPNTLGDRGDADALDAALPPAVAQTASRLAHWIVENPKTARAFLKKLGTATPLQQLQMQTLNVNTGADAVAALLEPLTAGHDVGLLSEAGVPAVADPGAALVALAHQRKIPVKPLVGPSSLLLALMGSGLNGQSFAFHGYLPVDAAARRARIQALEAQSQRDDQTQIFIETPYRNAQLLDALATTCRDDTLICAATDLTQAGEAITTRSASAWKAALQAERDALQRRPTVFLLLARR